MSQYTLGEDAARFGVVSFNYMATLRVNFSYNATEINAGIDEMTASGANGADASSVVVLTCTFRKTRADTYWIISHNADTRQISGHSEWRMEVDGQPCRDRSNNIKGSLDASFHGAGPNMHRPMYIRGICYRTASVARIAAGNHAVRWRQTFTSGDSYWGWNSNARLMVEVRPWTDAMLEVGGGKRWRWRPAEKRGCQRVLGRGLVSLVQRECRTWTLVQR